MKACVGTKIVCKCGEVAGHFRKDIDDNQSISGDDIVMDLDRVQEVIDWSYKCENCGSDVAKPEGDKWSVLLNGNWIN
jgi:hypothetical protein